MSWVPERKRTRDLHAFDDQVNDLARGMGRMRLPGPEYATAARPRPPPPPSHVDLAFALAHFVQFWQSRLTHALSLRWRVNNEYEPSVVVLYEPLGEPPTHLVTIQFADPARALLTPEPLFRVQTADPRHNRPMTAAQVLEVIREEYEEASSY